MCNLFSSNENTVNFKNLYSVAQTCKKVNSSKNGRFRYELIGEAQPEMELKWKFIYPFWLKHGVQSHLQQEINSLTQHRWILCAVLNFP